MALYRPGRNAVERRNGSRHVSLCADTAMRSRDKRHNAEAGQAFILASEGPKREKMSLKQKSEEEQAQLSVGNAFVYRFATTGCPR